MSFVAIGVTVAVAGTALSAYGQYQAGQSAKDMANYNEDLARNEAIATEQKAHIESKQLQRQKERLLASQRAGMAKSGSVISSGTNLLMMAEQAGASELDILNHNRNMSMNAGALRSQGDLYGYQGKQAARAGAIGSVATVLQGAGSIAMATSKPKPTGTE